MIRGVDRTALRASLSRILQVTNSSTRFLLFTHCATLHNCGLKTEVTSANRN
jgi:hypothetical protein